METLTDMPNIGPLLAGDLEKIGVTTHEQLCHVGVREAFLRIHAEVDSNACLHQLEVLAGAAEGVVPERCALRSVVVGTVRSRKPRDSRSAACFGQPQGCE